MTTKLEEIFPGLHELAESVYGWVALLMKRPRVDGDR
jgi:hypothetical protein